MSLAAAVVVSAALPLVSTHPKLANRRLPLPFSYADKKNTCALSKCDIDDVAFNINTRPQQTVYDGGDQEALTVVFSAEVMDGRFTLSNVFGLCENVGSIKLDLVTLTPHPAPWLPPPDKEWWQMELSDSTAPVGLVEIMLPHERDAKTFESFPNNEEWHAADCRGWWLYAPARCYHMMVLGEKPGIHPDLAL